MATSEHKERCTICRLRRVRCTLVEGGTGCTACARRGETCLFDNGAGRSSFIVASRLKRYMPAQHSVHDVRDSCFWRALSRSFRLASPALLCFGAKACVVTPSPSLSPTSQLTVPALIAENEDLKAKLAAVEAVIAARTSESADTPTVVVEPLDGEPSPAFTVATMIAYSRSTVVYSLPPCSVKEAAYWGTYRRLIGPELPQVEAMYASRPSVLHTICDPSVIPLPLLLCRSSVCSHAWIQSGKP